MKSKKQFARDDAKRLRDVFWRDYESATVLSKDVYLEALEELVADAEARIACVQDEMSEEKS